MNVPVDPTPAVPVLKVDGERQTRKLANMWMQECEAETQQARDFWRARFVAEGGIIPAAATA